MHVLSFFRFQNAKHILAFLTPRTKNSLSYHTESVVGDGDVEAEDRHVRDALPQGHAGPETTCGRTQLGVQRGVHACRHVCLHVRCLDDVVSLHTT